MPRPAVWTAIRDTLAADIAAGRYPAGGKLPTEAELAARFGVNRHTIRRALADLAQAGHLHARRGAGVFVTHTATDYAIGKRVRFHQNLAAQGRIPGKRFLLLETRAADPREAAALALPDGARVHAAEGLSLADNMPIAHFVSVFPADMLPDLPDHLRQTASVTAALKASGVADYTRAWTRLAAKPASATQALHLRLEPGAPVLRSEGLNIGPHGAHVEYGRTWFAGDRVTLTLGDD